MAELFSESFDGLFQYNKTMRMTVLYAFMAFSTFGNIATTTYTSLRVLQEIAKEGILPNSAFFARSTSLPNLHRRLPPLLILPAVSITAVLITTWIVPPVDAYNILVAAAAYSWIILTACLASAGTYMCRRVRCTIQDAKVRPSASPLPASPKLLSRFAGYLQDIWLEIFTVLSILLVLLPLLVPSPLETSDSQSFQGVSHGWSLNPWLLMIPVAVGIGVSWYLSISYWAEYYRNFRLRRRLQAECGGGGPPDGRKKVRISNRRSR